MKLASAVAFVAFTVLGATPAAAQVIGNPSFETNFVPPAMDPWTAAGAGSVAYVATAAPAFGDAYLPTDGSQFALLTAGSDDKYETLSQVFTLTQASAVSFDAAFLAFDETDDGPFNDDGYVSIGGVKLFSSDVETVGSFGNTPWTHVQVLLGPGTYTIEAGVENVGDDFAGGYQPGADSQLALDNVRVAAAVPEPASWILTILGFAGLGAALRARRGGALAA